MSWATSTRQNTCNSRYYNNATLDTLDYCTHKCTTADTRVHATADTRVHATADTRVHAMADSKIYIQQLIFK
jgi:hypothetical protein